jgi:DNA-binding CsgD family transcriptional regulator
MVATRALVGRDAELEPIRQLLGDRRSGAFGVCFDGEAGIGKSAVWHVGCLLAQESGFRVLTCRPAEAEARYSFSGLRDLLDSILDDVADGLPTPQRDALEIALLRQPPAAVHVDHRTVSAAVVTALRTCASRRAVCIAVDDLQWLDAPTVRVLAHALRRLDMRRVRFLATRRTPLQPHRGVEAADWLDDEWLEIVVLGPLAPAAVRELLRNRLRRSLMPLMLARAVELSAGNPLYALEVGRAMTDNAGDIEPGAPLPVSERIERLVSRRLAGMPASALEGLRMAAALHQPTVAVLDRALPHGWGSVAAAVDAGLISTVDGRVRFSHPLVASAVYRATPSQRRRWIHRRLATIVTDPEERARHLALTTRGPAAEVARALDEAGAAASRRGAPDAGAELAELAVLATPPGAVEDRWRRTVEAADRQFEAGNLARSSRLLERLLDENLPSPLRSDALARLGAIAGYGGDLVVCMHRLEEAIEAASGDAARCCAAEQLLAYAEASAGDFPNAYERARRTLEVAEGIGDPRLLIFSLTCVSYTSFVLGHGVSRALLDRAVDLEAWADPILAERHPRWLRAAVLRFAGELDAARVDLETCLTRFRDAGEYAKIPTIAWHLSELECWAGNWEAADRLASEATDTASETGSDLVLAYALYSRALIDAHLGQVESARAAALRGLRLAERAGDRTVPIALATALGFLELSVGRIAQAHEWLGPLPDLVWGAGIEEPGVFRFSADAIEVRVALGDLSEAERLLTRFEQQGRKLQRRWALATAARCRALLHAARGELPAALGVLDEAIDHHNRLGQPFEHARTLLVVGRVQRRRKQKRAPQDAFGQALEIFEALGATVWADSTRQELARTSLPTGSRTELSPMEARVARLAAEGRTNKEIASLLSVRPKTVEANLGRIYRKLHVRSRTELARVWSSPASPADRTTPSPR